MKLKIFEDWTLVFFIMILLVSSISAIKYFDSESVFEAQILNLNQNGEFSVDLQIDNLVKENLEFEVEILYKRGNLIVESKKIQCNSTCKENLKVKKIFFDKYELIIKTFYKGRGYKQEIPFIFDKDKSQFSASIEKTLMWNSKDLIVPIKINSSSNENTKYFVDIFPTKRPDVKKSFSLDCSGFCEKDLVLTSSIFFGDYTANIYSQFDVLKLHFNVISNSTQDFPQVTKPTQNNNSQIIENQTIENSKTPIPTQPTEKSENSTLIDESVIELNISKTIVNTSNAKLVRNYSQTIENLNEQILQKEKIIAINLEGEKVELENKSDILNNNEFIAVVTKNTIGEREEQIQIKPIIQNVNEVNEIDELELREISVTEKLQKQDNSAFEFSSFGGENIEPVSKQIIGETEIILEQTESGFDRTNLTLEKNLNSDTHKISPGIYKKERTIRYADGTTETKEEYFAYGLITVNTKKPLYTKGETVELLIVVLDNQGYLVSDANIQLEITKPNNESILLKTETFQIIETNKSGVYSTNILADEFGNYNLYAQVEQYNMIVDVQSYFNVVEKEKIEYQILRQVPATIDPWLGPYNNTFTIEPNQKNNQEYYSFTEVFSSDFTNISTNANSIETINDLTYLTWNNLIGTQNNLFYSAQVPLVTPYLYELGKSYVTYKNNQTFYENRPWLFAIDPVAQGPLYTSPAVCGAGCAGDNSGSNNQERGIFNDASVDCPDRNKNEENVQDIRVTAPVSRIAAPDGNIYFAPGDTVNAVVTANCYGSNSVYVGYNRRNGNAATLEDGEMWRLANRNCARGTRDYSQNITLSSDVGSHIIRGMVDYNQNNIRACPGGSYGDVDDIEIVTRDNSAPLPSNWRLDNGSSIGNNLNVIRGFNFSVYADWNKPLRGGEFQLFDGSTHVWMKSDTFDNNQTSKELQTSNLTMFPTLGNNRVEGVRANDYYFDVPGQLATGNRNINLFGKTKINQSVLTPYIIFEGNSSTMSCQVIDENVNVPYSGVTVEFFRDGSSLGTDTTNSTGWATQSFTTPIEGVYEIDCRISDELGNYWIASSTDNIKKINLTVKLAGADIIPPVISNIQNLTPTLFGVGEPFKTSADFTDETSLKLIETTFKNPSNMETKITYDAFDNLIAHWDFDKKTPTTIEDFSSNNITGTLENGATFSNIGGIRNNYGSFDGTGDRIDLTNLGQISSSEELTFTAWVKANNVDNDHSILTKGSIGPNAPLIFWRDNYGALSGRSDTLSILVTGNSTTARIEGAHNALNDNNWHHVAFTFKANDPQGLNIFIDGVKDPNSPVSTVGIFNITPTGNNAYLGNDVGNTRTLNGGIEDVWMYNKVLTDWEINNLFTHNSILNTSYEFEYGGTSEDGIYPYRFYAEDIADNPTTTSQLNFNAVGVRTFIGAQTTGSLYKVGQSVSMTSSQYILDLDSNSVTETGDIGYLFYDFESGDQGWSRQQSSNNQWARQTNSNCPSNSNCWATNHGGNYNAGFDQSLQSPIIDFRGRSNINIRYWRTLAVQNGVNSNQARAYLQTSIDGGSTWPNTLYQDTQNLNNLGAGYSDYFSSELVEQNQSRFRFRLDGNSGSAADGWRVDNINISFTPRTEWTNNWHEYQIPFGASGNRLTAIKFAVDINSYDNSGSTSNSNNNPDLEIQVFNGTDYEYSHMCNLNSGFIYPYRCEFLIKKNPTYLTAWEDPNNRKIRVRAINLDGTDSITFTNVKREFVLPSVIENHGPVPLNNILLQQIKNSSGHVVSTIYNSTVNIGAGSSLDLSTLGTFTVPLIPFGNYTFYSALVDLAGNVLQNGDDGSLVEDSYPFQIYSLTYENINPLESVQYSTNIIANYSLDTTYFGWGGFCSYSLDNGANQTMPHQGSNYFEQPISGLGNGQHSIQFFCNDSDGDIIASPKIVFDVGLVLSQDVKMYKQIKLLNNETRNYLVNLIIENPEGVTFNRTIYDFKDSKFDISNQSIIQNSIENFSNFNGSFYTWNLTIAPHSNTSINYILSPNTNNGFLGSRLLFGLY